MNKKNVQILKNYPVAGFIQLVQNINKIIKNSMKFQNESNFH